jgi:hypothetical protein
MQITNAQPYQSIFGTEKTQFNIFFTNEYKNLIGTTVRFYIENDTVIKQQQYKKISCENINIQHCGYSFYSGIREDTIGGKIYVYGEPFGEILTCDFSLSVGDTFFFSQYNNYLTLSELHNNNGFMIVDSIYNNEGRRTITFDGPFCVENGNVYSYFYGSYGYFQKVAFIEGIGPTYGPLDWIDRYQMLLCVHKDNDLIYMQWKDLECEYYNIESINEVILDCIKICPNPVLNEFYIQSDLIVDEIFIYTIQGQCVNHLKIQERSQEINITSLQTGIYLLRIKDIQGNIYSTKLVKL